MANDGNTPAWQLSLKHAITDPEELLNLLELDSTYLPAAKAAAKLFPLKVPRGFVARMKKGDITDPLLRQVLPIGCEMEEIPGYQIDPLEEKNFNPVPGLLHKYRSRVLITLVGVCGVNCRFCFRRSFPYAENNPGKNGWDKIFDYIKHDPNICEVILSGGDPLVASDALLQAFTDQLAEIQHVSLLRIHSRIPIVMPERVTPEFIQWLSTLKQKPVLIVHCNHPQEINHEVKNALRSLSSIGITVLNQSVLLKNINDNAKTLIALSTALFACGVLPYYLHLPDKVKGTAHFDIEMTRAQALYSEISTELPGYLLPRLVCEEPGKRAKTLVSPPDFYT